MSESQSVSLLFADPKFLLLSIDPDGRQNAVSLIAYGADPEVPDATLAFTTTTPHTYQEIRFMMPFNMFHFYMNSGSHMSMTNVEQSAATITAESELGLIVTDFKRRIAQAIASRSSYKPQ